MKKITTRFCDEPLDHDRLLELLLAYRSATDVRRYPTIWRVRLLLTSRVWEPEKDSRIWEWESGEIIAFAMLWRRQPLLPTIVLDGFMHPGYGNDELLWEMLQWGDQRGQEIAAEQKTPLTVYANGFSHNQSADPALRKRGFVPVAPNPNEHNVYFARALQTELPAPSLPPGYTIRLLTEIDDLEAYQSLNGFTQVNPRHQKELLSSDEYRHFVVVNPGGEFVAYCECSICRAEWQLTNQRIGWIDYVETTAAHQGKGLGQAVLLTGLTQLKAWGADVAMLVTINTNLPAVKLYSKTGFTGLEIPQPVPFQKQIEPGK